MKNRTMVYALIVQCLAKDDLAPVCLLATNLALKVGECLESLNREGSHAAH